MSESLRLRSLLAMGVSAAAILGIAAPAFAQDDTTGGGTIVGEVVVTAQKREEAIQDVPIAVSAFSQEMLEAQGIEGGPDLLISIPNVSFAKSNFTNTFNFQIRGIGSKGVGVSGDSGVGVHLNNAPLQSSNLFEAEFYDVERVEVLRGPQGTLYGRNATGGVVNIITAKPINDFEAMIRGEFGNYDTYKIRGMINIPLGDKVAVRAAGNLLSRSGFSYNTYNGNDVDSRDLWSSRVTVAFEPIEAIRASLMWEHFEEDDSRARIGKQLCTKDEGPATVGGVATGSARQYLTQGCLPGSLYAPEAYGTIHTGSTLTGVLGNLVGFTTGDLNAGDTVSTDLREIESVMDPIYQSKSNVFQFNLSIDLTESLMFTALTSFSKGEVFSQLDYNRNVSTGTFNSTPLTPGGFFDDPQVGLTNTFRTFDISSGESEQFSQELRLQSNFDGPINFNVGGIYFDYEALSDYIVYGNSLTISALALNATNPLCTADADNCIGIDPESFPTGEGHNYYDNHQPYHLKSRAAFGEVYYQVSDALKFTLGLRYTHDRKLTEQFSTALLAPGLGLIQGNPPVRIADFRETTGRVGFDWKPVLGFTDETLLYAFYSKGYKGGGVNPPAAVGISGIQATFDPEFVNAIEVGAKNTLMSGSLILNVTGFYYDYQGYQISKIVNRTSVNENIDAVVYGAELETIWQPIQNLRLNANIGWLKSEIGDGVTSIDTMNRTQGDPTLTLVKGARPTSALGSNCLLSTAGVATVLAAGAGSSLPLACAGPGTGTSSYYTEFTNALLTRSTATGGTVGVNAVQAAQIQAVLATAGGPSAGATVLGTAVGTAIATGQITGLTAANLGLVTPIITQALTANAVANTFGLYNYGSNVTLNTSGVAEGIEADLSGNSLPNSPEWTFSVGAQYTWDFADWSLTPRIDYYRQSEQYTRIYNTEYDRLESWENVNLSVTLRNPVMGLEVQGYVHNALDDTPITDAYTGDDTSLFTNVYTLEPRTFGVSFTKSF
jgi:outer membrane receptor protein involved in Fe transport